MQYGMQHPLSGVDAYFYLLLEGNFAFPLKILSYVRYLDDWFSFLPVNTIWLVLVHESLPRST